MGARERALAPRRRTALGALLRALVRRPRQRRRRAGARTLGRPQRAEEPGLCPALGGNVRTAPLLCLAHCGDLAFPGRERAPQLEEQRRPRTFLCSEGRPAGRTAPVLQSGAPRRRGDGAQSARSVRRRRPVLERGPQGLETPGGGPEPSPRPASGAPASAPLFPPGLEAPRTERHWDSSACRRALAAQPGPERSPGAAGRSRGRGRPPARTSHGGLSRGGTAAPSEVRAAAPPDPGRAWRPERPPAPEPPGCALSAPKPSRIRRLPLLATRPPPPPDSPQRSAPPFCLPSLRSARVAFCAPSPRPSRRSSCRPTFPPTRAGELARRRRRLRGESGRDRAGAKAAAALGLLGLGRRVGVGSEECVRVCVCCIPLHLFLVHSWGLTPIQQVALGGTLKIRGISKSLSTSGRVWGRGWEWVGRWG